MDWKTVLIQGAIPVVVPVVIAILRKLLPSMPKVWMPIAAPFLGALAEIAGYYAGVISEANPALGAALGSAGVGLREIVDQLRKTVFGTGG